MKTIFTLAFLAITTLTSAQPGHHKHHKNKEKKHSYGYYDKKYSKQKKYYAHQHAKPHKKKVYYYEVEREMRRYDFLRMSDYQRNRLEISLNYMFRNGYGPREYERRLRSDLHSILNRRQYEMWQQQAYGRNQVFVFNFGR